MTLFRYLAIFILVYFFLRFLRRLFVGMIRPREKFEQTKNDVKEKKRKIIPDNEGEYVDYEDIDKK